MNTQEIDFSSFGAFGSIGDALKAVAEKKASEAAKAAGKPVPAPATVRLEARKCVGENCVTSFLPMHPSHTLCKWCHRKEVDAQQLAAAEQAKLNAARNAKEEHLKGCKLWMQNAYEAGELPAETKVVELGKQVTVSFMGISVTFHSPKREAFLAAEKRESDRKGALEAKAQAEAKKKADALKAAEKLAEAATNPEPKKQGKATKNGKNNDKKGGGKK